VRKSVFYIRTNIVPKKWGEKKRNNFSRNTGIVRPKNVGKKSSEKSAKKRFLYPHEYRDQKMGEKRAKQFFQKHTNCATKKCWETIVRKKFEKAFFI